MSESPREIGGRGRDSIANTLVVAICLSLVCSLLIASTAILLRPQQLRNKNIYRQTIIVDVAGLLVPGTDIDVIFEGIDTRMVNLASGDYIYSVDPGTFDAQTAANDPDLSIEIPDEFDLAKIRRRAIYAPVYLVEKDGVVEQIILPVYGSGLWSTMYGYLSLAGDGTTVRGLRFYEHAETPGLGDQIDNAKWRAQWSGKRLYDGDGEPRIEVVRGKALGGADAPYQIDGLSGATLTGRGVSNLVQYWIGPHGFGPYLKSLRKSSYGN